MHDVGSAGIHLHTMGCTCVNGRVLPPPRIAQPRIPPSMLMPSPRHRMQLDQWFPPYPVGTGDDWPADTEPGEGSSRRMPIGLLWQLAMDERLWKVDSETSVVFGLITSTCR